MTEITNIQAYNIAIDTKKKFDDLWKKYIEKEPRQWKCTICGVILYTNPECHENKDDITKKYVKCPGTMIEIIN